MVPKILMGADPELFVADEKKRFRSAYGLVSGTKEEPFKVDKGAYQVDGMALEFNIDPAENEDQWVDNLSSVLHQLREAVPNKYTFEIVPSCKFHGNHMRVQPEEAKELGCMPDFNSYTMAENPRPNGATTLRTAAGHIHIGFCEGADPTDEMHVMRCATLAKHLDAFLGLRSLEWDDDQRRRKLYGSAGAIRIKPYGAEYRVLSNAWLRDERIMRFVYNQTLRCIDHLRSGGKLDDVRELNYIKDEVNGRIYSGYNKGTARFRSQKFQNLMKAVYELEI